MGNYYTTNEAVQASQFIYSPQFGANGIYPVCNIPVGAVITGVAYRVTATMLPSPPPPPISFKVQTGAGAVITTIAGMNYAVGFYWALAPNSNGFIMDSSALINLNLNGAVITGGSFILYINYWFD